MTTKPRTVEADVYEYGTTIPYQQGGSYKIWVSKLHEIINYSGMEIGSEDSIYIGFNEPSGGAAFVTGEIYIGSEKPTKSDSKKWYKMSEEGESGKITIPVDWLNMLCPDKVSVEADKVPIKIWGGDGVIVLEPTQYATYTDRLDVGKDRRVTITKPMKDIVGEDSNEEYYIEFAGDFEVGGCVAGNVFPAADANENYNLSRKVGYTNEEKYYVTIPANLFERIDWEAPDGIHPYITISTEGGGLIFCKPEIQTVRYQTHQRE